MKAGDLLFILRTFTENQLSSTLHQARYNIKTCTLQLSLQSMFREDSQQLRSSMFGISSQTNTMISTCILREILQFMSTKLQRKSRLLSTASWARKHSMMQPMKSNKWCLKKLRIKNLLKRQWHINNFEDSQKRSN